MAKHKNGLIETLDEPIKIQEFLYDVEYNPEGITKSPRRVIEERKAHCMEGALFAAAHLRAIGYEPLIIDLRAINDDDHAVAVYKHNSCWGAVAKSNFTTLAYREPVYRTLRELAMSYFDFYFNTKGEKTLREYSVPLNLSRYDKDNWVTTEKDLSYIGYYLDSIKHYKLITPAQKRILRKASSRLLEASLLKADPEGLYTPE